MRRAALLGTLVLAGRGGGGGAEPKADAPTAAKEPPKTAIRAADVCEHLRALQRIADRNDANRSAGTKGDRETADYIAGQLRKAGWHVRFQTLLELR